MTICPTRRGSSAEILLISLHLTTLPLKLLSASVPLLLLQPVNRVAETAPVPFPQTAVVDLAIVNLLLLSARVHLTHASYACVVSRSNSSSYLLQKQIS